MNYIGTFIKDVEGIQVSLDREYNGHMGFNIKMSDYRGSTLSDEFESGTKFLAETHIIPVDGHNLGIGCDTRKEFKVGNKTIAPIFDIGPM